MDCTVPPIRAFFGKPRWRLARRLSWLGAGLLFAVLLLFAAPALLPWDLNYWFPAKDTPAALAPPAGARDAFQQPFASDSVWNLPLASGARYAPIASPAFSIDAGGNLNVTSWSHPVYQARPDDPWVTVRAAERGEPLQLRVPPQAQPDSRADGHLHIVEPGGRWVHEMYQAVRHGEQVIEATCVVRNDLHGSGVYDHWHGVRAYGGSALGGLIREGELTTGIRHALAVAVRRDAMNARGPDGKPYVWPASSADDGWQVSYGRSGNLYMGSLLAIPPEVDLDTLGLRSTAGRMIAQALQDYGAYVTDAADANIVFYAAPDCAAEVPLGIRYDLRRIVAHLHVVANNRPQTPGGGGQPRVPLAPRLRSEKPAEK